MNILRIIVIMILVFMGQKEVFAKDLSANVIVDKDGYAFITLELFSYGSSLCADPSSPKILSMEVSKWKTQKEQEVKKKHPFRTIITVTAVSPHTILCWRGSATNGMHIFYKTEEGF